MDKPGHLPSRCRKVLKEWAESKPSINALSVFGSFAQGEARNDSDLDLALDFINVDEPNFELICNAYSWKRELSGVAGVVFEHLYHDTSPVVSSPKLLIYLSDAKES